jgi:alginate O-acetyltransferase complex protein AlgJ
VSTDVYAGKDGWLFLIGGSNAVGRLYDRDSPALPDDKIRQWAELIENRARRLERLGIRYIHMNIPEKLTVYDHKLHSPLVDWTLSPAMRLGEMLQRSPYGHVWLDLIEPFRATRDERQLYYRTDTHWSAEGCFLGYRLLCERIGIDPDLTLLARPHQEFEGVFDLGSKMHPSVSECVRVYDYAKYASRVHRNRIAKYQETPQFTGAIHVGSHVRYRNEARGAAEKRIMLFGDSYSLPGRTALTGMLAETARDVEFIWSGNFNWNYIRRRKPDFVIYELAERFMRLVPHDNLSFRRILLRQVARANWLALKHRIRGTRIGRR